MLRSILGICPGNLFFFLAIIEYKSEKRSILSVFLPFVPAPFNTFFVESQICLKIML